MSDVFVVGIEQQRPVLRVVDTASGDYPTLPTDTEWTQNRTLAERAYASLQLLRLRNATAFGELPSYECSSGKVYYGMLPSAFYEPFWNSGADPIPLYMVHHRPGGPSFDQYLCRSPDEWVHPA